MPYGTRDTERFTSRRRRPGDGSLRRAAGLGIEAHPHIRSEFHAQPFKEQSAGSVIPCLCLGTVPSVPRARVKIEVFLPLRDISGEPCGQPEVLKVHWPHPGAVAVMPDAGTEVGRHQLDLPGPSVRLVPWPVPFGWVVVVYRLQTCGHLVSMVAGRGGMRLRRSTAQWCRSRTGPRGPMGDAAHTLTGRRARIAA